MAISNDINDLRRGVIKETEVSGQPGVVVTGAGSGGVPVSLSTALQALIAGVENDSILVMPGRRSDAFNVAVEFTASTTPQSVKALTSDKSHYITDISVSVDSAMWVQLVDTDGTFITGKKWLPANSVWSKHYKTPKKVVLSKAIMLDCSVSAGNVSVDVDGYTI